MIYGVIVKLILMHLLTLKLIKLIRQDALYCKHMQIKHPVIHINTNMNFIYN